MMTGDDLAFVRLAMRRRLVSANKIREAVERKRWDNAERTLAEILVDMGALDRKVVEKLASEVGGPVRQTLTSERPSQRTPAVKSGPRSPSGNAIVPVESSPALSGASGISTQESAPDARTERYAAPAGPKRVGPYEIVRLIGAGAMGAVYEARDKALDRTVALKLLLGEGPPTARAVARFKREAKLSAKLDHPNIVRVHGAGQEDGHHYIAMDLIDGRSLSELVAMGEVPPRRAIHLARKIALAMAHAHERGVLHRDLKPANVLVDEKGEPRVTDFGLAVLAEPDESDRLTRTGAAVGTPAYMSPEQARGELDEIDPRTDVYAVGATLYEMLTGGPPFEAPTFLELARKICDQEPPSPRKKNPEVPVDLETICLKALEKEKPDRYQSAIEMVQDLARLLEDAPVVAKRPSLGVQVKRWTARHRALSVAIVASVLIFLGGLVHWWRLPGFLRIETVPTSARVTIDGRPLAQVPQGTQGFQLSAGTHELRFEAPGYEPITQRVDVSRGQNDPYVGVLPRLMGTIKLQSDPPGGRVTLSRVTGSGTTALVTTELMTNFERLIETGTYEWTVEKPGYLPEPVRTVRVGKNAEETLDAVVLRKDLGSLDLEVDPRGAVVHAERGGEAPDYPATDGHVEVKLGTGDYRVSVSKAGYFPWTFAGPVREGARSRASLAPLRSFAFPLEGRLVAEPVVGDVDGDGVPDVLVLEEDEYGRWLALFPGGGLSAPRWRVRTSATSILRALGDADQDGVLDVALETAAGVEVRDGETGERLLAVPVAPGRDPSSVVRATAYRTRKTGALCVVAASFGAGEADRAVLEVTGLSCGWVEVKLVLPESARGRGSVPVIVEAPAAVGGDPTGYAVFAFQDKLVAFRVPLDPDRELRSYDAKDPIVIDAPGVTDDSQLEALGTDEVAVCPRHGPMLVYGISEKRKLAELGSPRTRFEHPRATPLGLRAIALAVHDRSEVYQGTLVLGCERRERSQPRSFAFLGRIPNEDALLLPPDAAATKAARQNGGPDVRAWARGRVLELRAGTSPEKASCAEVERQSGEAAPWALEGPLTCADVDGCGAAEVLAPSRDGRALVVLSPSSPLRWRASAPGGVLDATVADLDGDGTSAVVLLGAERVVALDGRDGRTIFSADAPRARAVTTIRAGKGRDVVVLGAGTLARYRGSDGALVWQKEAPRSRTVVGVGVCVCGLNDEEDLILGDPLALVSASKQAGKAVWAFDAAPPGRGRLAPVALDVAGKRCVFGRVPDGSSTRDPALACLRASPKKEVGWPAPVRIPESATLLLPAAPIEQGGIPTGLWVGSDEGLDFFLVNDGRTSSTRAGGRGSVLRGPVRGLATPRIGGSGAPLLVLEETQGSGRGGVRRRAATARSVVDGATRWSRTLPPGSHAAAGPVLLDGDQTVAYLAPSGSIVILRVSDGAWLTERRAPEGELAPRLAACPTTNGTLLIALAADGQVLAFDSVAREAPRVDEVLQRLRTDDRTFEVERAGLLELSRRLALWDDLGERAAAEMSERTAQVQAEPRTGAMVSLVLARAHFRRNDLRAAASVAVVATRTAPRLAAAQALSLRVSGRLALEDGTWDRVRDATDARLRELAQERPARAAVVAGDLIFEASVRGATLLRPELAQEFAEAAVVAAPSDPLVRRARALIRLARLREKRGLADGRSLAETRAELSVVLEDVSLALERGDSPEIAMLAAAVAQVFRSAGALDRARELVDVALAAAPSDPRARCEDLLLSLEVARRAGRAAADVDGEVVAVAQELARELEGGGSKDARDARRELLERLHEPLRERALDKLRALPQTKKRLDELGGASKLQRDLLDARDAMRCVLRPDGRANDPELAALASLVALAMKDDRVAVELARDAGSLAGDLREAAESYVTDQKRAQSALRRLFNAVSGDERRKATFHGVILIARYRSE